MISDEEFLNEISIKDDFDIYSFAKELLSWQNSLVDFDIEDSITYSNIETIKTMIMG